MFRPNNPQLDYGIINERIDFELALRAKRRDGDKVHKTQFVPQQQSTAPACKDSLDLLSSAKARGRGFIIKFPIFGALLTLWTRRHALARMLAALLFDARNSAPDGATNARFAGKRKLLFVGAWQDRKGQLELVQTFEVLKEICDFPVQLILAGKMASAAHLARVQSEIVKRNLQDDVLTIEDPSTDELTCLYQTADIFVSLSQIERLSSAIKDGLPLLRALTWDLPVIALCSGIVPFLLSSGGMLVEAFDPDRLAGLCKLLLEEPWLRRQLIEAQRSEARRLDRFSLAANLRRARCKLKATLWARFDSYPTSTCQVGGWRIEGPFDSSYSLAVVNREVALALSRQGEDVALVSRDGPGPFPPNQDFLEMNPAFGDMWRRGVEQRQADVVLRNTYPPWVSDLKADLRGLVCYAWEESGFPAQYVREFNSNLDLITVTSRFVAKTLRDNGVRMPIRVIGDGIDQMTRLAMTRQSVDETCKRYGIGEGFCFLHVSSALPRKGIDLLLAAWAEAFQARDDVVLVIKTTENQHHQITTDVAEFANSRPQSAPIRVINENVGVKEIRALYERCDVVVAPSRGEGFGLPIAEALALGKPVITTGFGGQMDFCTEENAWLCEYDFGYAKSHLSPPLSVWAEPRLVSLSNCLKRARSSSVAELQRRGRNGQTKVRDHFAWAHVASRLRNAIADVRLLDSRALALPKVGWISTWNSRCDIAAYSQALTMAIPAERLTVFANSNAQLLGPDLPNVKRCWEQGWRDPLDQLDCEIERAQVDAVVVQFNLGFFDLNAFSTLARRLQERAIPLYVTLHSTAEVYREGMPIRLSQVTKSLSFARRIFVHSVHDLNRLKQLELVENVTILPFGLPQAARSASDPAGKKKRVATFGYMRAHKGFPELVQAIALLRQGGMDVDLVVLSAIYPAEESEQILTGCRAAISANGLEQFVQLRTDYLPEEEVLAELAKADLVVYPYQTSEKSVSAAVRFGLASLVPVATTPLAMFDDVAAITHRLPGVAPFEIACGIEALLLDGSQLSRFALQQKSWVAQHEWRAVSRRLYDLVRGELVNDVLRSPHC